MCCLTVSVAMILRLSAAVKAVSITPGLPCPQQTQQKENAE